MLKSLLIVGMIIYIVSSGIGFFIRSLILTDKQNARDIFKSILGPMYKDFEKADQVVNNLLLFSAILPVINTIFAIIFLHHVVVRLWELVRGFHDKQQ